MSFLDCINKNENLKPNQKKAVQREYERILTEFTNRHGAGLAPQLAAEHMAQEYAKKLLIKKNNAMLDVVQWQNMNANIKDVANGYEADKKSAGWLGVFWGKSKFAAAARAILERAYVAHQALEREVTLSIADAVEKLRSKHAGLTQDTEAMQKVVRVLYGEKSDDAGINAMAKMIRENVFDSLGDRFRAAGGMMGKLDNYFPQMHNAVAVSKLSFDDWYNTLTPLLDRDKIISDIGIPLSNAELRDAMKGIYESIVSGGLDEIALRAEAGKQMWGKAGNIVSRYDSSRFFHFKDADSYFAYNKQFGFGDAGLFDAMMGYVHQMTRDIAILQEIGVNPSGQFNRMRLMVQGEGAPPQALKTLDGMYDTLTGRNGFNGKLPLWYNVNSNVQHLLRSALLGSAPVSALTDSFFVGMTAKLNGIPATSAMSDYFKMLNPLDNGDRMVARQNAFIASAAQGASIAQARFADDMGGGNGTLQFLSNFTNRASGLAAMTDAARSAVVLSTQAFMANAKAAKLAFRDLPQAMQEAFARWGMGEADYKNIINAAEHIADNGATFVRPNEVMSISKETARKYNMWLTDMSQTASNEPRLLTRAIATGAVLGDARKGTVLRAGVGNIMMFKSFGITMILNHLLPSLRHFATAKGMDRLTRLAPMLIGTTILGAAAMQAKALISGKTPQDMDKAAFWQAAMMQGGGFGIFGDYLLSDSSRFGQHPAVTAAGPVFSFWVDAGRVFTGNFDRALDEGQETKFMADAYQFARRYAPASKLWYLRLPLERMLLDQGERMIDPLYDTRIRRIEQKMQKERGQEFYWQPADMLP